MTGTPPGKAVIAMRRVHALLAVAALLGFVLGCTSPVTMEAKTPPVCPKCKAQMVRHRFSRGGIPGHTHVKYICPSCCTEWTGPGAADNGFLCPRCGCGLKECPGCMAKPKS
jgi:hypothetical protein